VGEIDQDSSEDKWYTGFILALTVRPASMIRFPIQYGLSSNWSGLEDLSPHVESDGLYCWLVFQYVSF
jgi:hypothetical protein